MSRRDNYGNCHFYGGGDIVKHGDPSSALSQPPLAVDVHLSPDGEHMSCSTCHVEERHQWPGPRCDVLAAERPDIGPGGARAAASRASCHCETALDRGTLVGMKLNDHTDVLACQSCHIPEFARGNVPTETVWDRPTAGRLEDTGKPIVESDWISPPTGERLHGDMTVKGDFDWGEDVVPRYAWFDGHVEYTLAEDTIDPGAVVEINRIKGEPGDRQSRIWPFTRMIGRRGP